MSRLLIESAQCDVADGEIVVAEAKIIPEGGTPFYVSMAEVEGMALFYRSEDSTFELQMDSDDPEETGRILNEKLLWSGDYEDLFASEDLEWLPLFRYLVYLVRSEWSECENMIAKSAGHYLDEVEVPVIDVEEDDYEEDDYESDSYE